MQTHATLAPASAPASSRFPPTSPWRRVLRHLRNAFDSTALGTEPSRLADEPDTPEKADTRNTPRRLILGGSRFIVIHLPHPESDNGSKE